MVTIKRKILFYLFLFLFIIITPLIILYANGYKINPSRPGKIFSIQKTGMIFLKTEPKQAKVIIDNKIQKSFLKNIFNKETSTTKTPAKIKGLLPGKYEVRLELDGYWPWTKKVEVSSGQITHLNNIRLFKNTEPNLIVSSTIQNIKKCLNKEIIYLPENKLLIDTKNGQKQKIENNQEEIQCLENGKKMLINNKIYNLENLSLEKDLEKDLGNNIENVKWFNDDPEKIIYKHKNTINSFDISSKKNKTLLKNENCLDFFVKGNYIFCISLNYETVKLKMYSLKENRAIKEIELPYSKEYKFKNQNKDLLNIYDQKYNILYLIDPLSFISPLQEIISNIKYQKWINDKTLLYASDFEIWTFNMETGKKKLITRISDKINNVMVTKNEKYILYSTASSINVIELAKEKNNSTQLINMKKVSAPILSEDKKTLFFTAKWGQEKGLFKLNIK